jgi:hypothetical protein
LPFDTTRRDVIKSMAALPLLRFAGADPDLILYNGSVYTVQAGNPLARTMLGGRWVYES